MSKKAKTVKAIVNATVPAAEPVGNFIPSIGKFAPSVDMQPSAYVAPKAEKIKVVRVTKKQQVFDLLCSGKYTAATIGEIMQISTVAARSLIGDLRRDMQNVQTSFENKVYYYTASK